MSVPKKVVLWCDKGTCGPAFHRITHVGAI